MRNNGNDFENSFDLNKILTRLELEMKIKRIKLD